MVQLVLFILLLFASPVAADVYIATGSDTPAGNDANTPCASASVPCKTWAVALQLLDPGETLYVADGTYNNANGAGYPNIDCNLAAYKDGTALNPITVKATNQRQALIIQDNPSSYATTFKMENCSYWIIEGLHMANADTDLGSPYDDGLSDVFRTRFIDNLTLRYNIFRNPNRYKNSHPVSFLDSSAILFEYNEVYNFHRHGVIVTGPGGADDNTDQVTYRMNYCNSRSVDDVASCLGPEECFSSVQNNTGDACYSFYPGRHNIAEGNIAEQNYIGYWQIAQYNGSPSTNNRWYSNIAYDNTYGFQIDPWAGGTCEYLDGEINHSVAIGGPNEPSRFGFWLVHPNQFEVNNTSSFHHSTGTLPREYNNENNYSECSGDGSYSVDYQNTLAVDNGSGDTCYRWSSGFGYTADYPNAYNCQVADYVTPDTEAGITNKSTADPSLGSCRVFIPDASPLKGAGLNGADIGANAIWRYENGTETRYPMFDILNGGFLGCGAIIPGVNDIAGSSCFDVHERINAGDSDCAFDLGYRLRRVN